MSNGRPISTPTATTVPAHVEGVSLHREGSRAVLRDESGTDLCLLNDTAAALWESCDGSTTVGEIVGAARELWRVPPDIADREIRSAFEALNAAGVIHWGEEDRCPGDV